MRDNEETIAGKDRLATISIDRMIKTRRPIRIFHRILTARNNQFHDRRSPWTTIAIIGPEDNDKIDVAPTIPVLKSTLKEALLVAENQVNQGKDTAGTHPEQDWMIKNRLYPR